MTAIFMLRSVKSQIVAATSLIILVILGATAYFVIDQKSKELNNDIFVKAMSFAELTHERIARNYEENYVPQAFANFNREMADIMSLNSDIEKVNIFNYKGEKLYRGDSSADVHRLQNDTSSEGRSSSALQNDTGSGLQNDTSSESASAILSPEELERVQAVWPSVLTIGGRVVYFEKNDEVTRTANFNGRDVPEIKNIEQISDIIYPFRAQNDITSSYSIRYTVSYGALGQRVRSTVFNIGFLALLGVAIALYAGGMVAGRITSPIRILIEGATKIGKGDLKTRVGIQSKSEIGLLAGTFNKMAEDLEKSTQDLVAKEKLTREFELAGQIQKELLPKELPSSSGLDIAASLQSATEVGGDCYDFLQLAPNRLLFYIADVTGHGVPAGLVSAISNALVPALIEHYPDPRDLVINLNKILKLKTRANMFMTMVMALWDEAKSELSFTQAGHDPILHYEAKKSLVSTLATGGMALGMIADISKLAKTETIKVAKEDVLVFYTDGIPEAWENEKENYGMNRLKESVARHSKLKTAQSIHDALLKDVHEFMGKYPQQDDITLIVVKRI